MLHSQQCMSLNPDHLPISEQCLGFRREELAFAERLMLSLQYMLQTAAHVSIAASRFPDARRILDEPALAQQRDPQGE
jgi:hypothetical protein